MFQTSKLYNPKRQPPTKLIIVLLAVLTLAVMAISAIALTRSATPSAEGIPATGTPKPTVTSVPEPSQEPSEEPTPEPTTEEPETPAVINAVVPDRLLTVVNKDILVRSMVGSCTQPGTIEFSKDGGKTWKESTTVAATNSTLHMRVLPTRATNIQLISLDKDCKPQLVRTENQGTSWVAPTTPTGAWFFNPETPTTINAPDGKVDAPCSAVAFAAAKDGAAVLCDDSTIITTTDKAATWKEPISVPGAIAINVSDDGYVVGVANQGECVGLQTLEVKGATVGTLSSCLERDLKEGTVAVARTSGSVLAWIGNDLANSPDGGETWNL